MPTPGLSPEGFTPASVQDTRDDINSRLRGSYGTSVRLDDGSVLGMLVGIIAEIFALLWEVGEAVYNSQDPDSATGAALDGLCALTGTVRLPAAPSEVTLTLTGTVRLPAAPSEVTLTLTGTNATVVPTGSRASTLSTGIEFETVEDVTLATLTSWVNTTGYTVGQRRTNASRAYVVIAAGTSAGSGGPTTTDDDITDGTVHWRYMGEGAAAGDALAEALETGPQVALSGDITEIETPVSGWSSVINLLDADEGNDVETDEELRVRRELELSQAGASTPDAIRAALLDVADVTSATIFVNNTDTTDGDGVPPHAIEALVQGGEDQDIFDTLLASVAAGIATHGTEDGTAEDSQGTEHDISFSRPDEIEIYVDVEIIYDEDTYPADGEDQIKAAIIAYGDAQATGKDVVSSRLIAAIFGVPGVLDVITCDIGTSSNPSASTTITIALRELAVFDTSRITLVSATPGTP